MHLKYKKENKMDIRYFLDKKVGWPLLCACVRLSHARRDTADWLKKVRKANEGVRAARHVTRVKPRSDDAWDKLNQAKDYRRKCFREMFGLQK